MKSKMKIGEIGIYDGVKYKCVAGSNCEDCDLRVLPAKLSLCKLIMCKKRMRPDCTDVIFVTKKAEGGYRAYTKEEARRVYGDK